MTNDQNKNDKEIDTTAGSVVASPIEIGFKEQGPDNAPFEGRSVPRSDRYVLVTEVGGKSGEHKSKFELTVEMIKALAWPVFAAVVLIVFWAPLRSMASELPNLLSRSETLSIAGLSLKVGRSVSRPPSDKVRSVLTQLSAESVQKLLDISNSTWWDSGYSPSSEYSQLVDLGLLESVPEDEIKKTNKRDGKHFAYGLRITPLGKEAQSFLYEVLTGFVRELNRSDKGSSTKE